MDISRHERGERAGSRRMIRVDDLRWAMERAVARDSARRSGDHEVDHGDASRRKVKHSMHGR